MHKKKQKEKFIGENEIQKYSLVLNMSLGVFVLGKNIEEYLHISHLSKCHDYETFSTVTYEFYDGTVVVWIRDEDEKRIWTIKCISKCFWERENLIGMSFDKFLVLAGQQPEHEDLLYVPVSPDRGQNQKVYTFYDLGLQVWVWRNKIRTILISNYDEE